MVEDRRGARSGSSGGGAEGGKKKGKGFQPKKAKEAAPSAMELDSQ